MEAQTTDSAESNRRISRRNRTLKKATIIIHGGYSVYDCIIRNLSETGAMLQVDSLGIPSRFQLKFDSPVPVHPCTVRWRTETTMGVSFDDVQLAA